MGIKCAVVPVTPFQQNCSVFWCEETMKGAIVDAGGDLDRVKQVIERYKVIPEKLLVTHSHLDHASGVAQLAEDLDVPIEGPHPDDQFLIDALPEQAAKYGFPPARSFTPTRWLAHGDKVTVGNVVLDVAHCPGHTPGQVVFIDPATRLAFVGDVLFKGSVGRSDFPRGNHEHLVSSIRDRLFPLGDDITFVSGHGETSTFGFERKCNPYVSDLAVGAG